MIAIVGPLTIANRGLIAAVTAREQITANYLAQDAMEYIKNIRDGSLIEGDIDEGALYWTADFNENGVECSETTNKRCTVDTITGAQTECSSSTTCGQLYFDSEQRFTHVNTGNPTLYKRFYTVVMKETATGIQDEARVQVTVVWKSGKITNTTSIKSNLYNVYR